MEQVHVSVSDVVVTLAERGVRLPEGREHRGRRSDVGRCRSSEDRALDRHRRGKPHDGVACGPDLGERRDRILRGVSVYECDHAVAELLGQAGYEGNLAGPPTGGQSRSASAAERAAAVVEPWLAKGRGPA